MMILRIEDSKWIKSFPTYFIILKNIHELYFNLMLCSIDEFEKVEEIIYLLSVQISRIVPLHCKKGSTTKTLNYSDGILQLKSYVDFLENDYNELYNNCKKGLTTLSEIRNKYEHEPHNIIGIRYFSNDKEQVMDFAYKKYDRFFLDTYPNNIQEQIKAGKLKLEWEINTTEIGKILLQLNNIFRKIQIKYIDASKDYKDFNKYPIYKQIININFEKVNKNILFYTE